MLFFRHYPDGSSTLLQRRTGLSVSDVIKQALRKRGIRFGEYVLEVKGQPHVSLNSAEKIADVEAAQRERVEFTLIKKYGTLCVGFCLILIFWLISAKIV